MRTASAERAAVVPAFDPAADAVPGYRPNGNRAALGMVLRDIDRERGLRP